MKDVIIKCEKGEVKKTLAYIEKKDRKVRWASEDKPTGYGGWFEENGVYLVIENNVLTFIYVDEFEDARKKGKTVVSADEFLGKSKSPHIVIFRRGRNVIAKDVATGNEGIAKCSPDDEFVFKTGASIALARLMSKTPDALNHDVKDEWVKALGLAPVEKRVYTDADRNFKVGDRVVVRDWDDMEKEYGVSKWGDIPKDSQFTSRMKHLCGRTATVTCVEKGFSCKKVNVDFDDKSGSTACWTFNSWMFNPTDIPAPKKEKPESKFKVGNYVTLKEGVEANKKYGGLPLLSGPMHDFAYHKRMRVVGVDWQEEVGTYYYECYHDGKFTFHYFEEMLDKWDESKIHEGDKVRIKKGCTGNRFDLYYEWVKEHISDPDLLLAFERGDHIDTSLDYEVVKIAPHKVQSRTLAYIKYKDDSLTLCYLFDIEALEKV